MVTLLLVLSLAANAAAGLVLIPQVRRRRATHRPPDYARLAAERFALPSDGCVVFAGDSQLSNAPLLDMLTPYRQWGMGGQTIADIRTWLPNRLDDRVSRLVISAGTNDVLLGAPASEVVSRYAGLLDVLPNVPTTLLGLPPLAGYESVTREVNAGLRALAESRAANFVPLSAAGFGDGIHLSREDYERLAADLRDQVAG